MKTYKIVINGAERNTYEAKEVEGSAIDVGAAPFVTFVHRLPQKGTIRGYKWGISEASSGNSLCHAYTRKEVITKAKEIVARIPKDKFAEVVAQQVKYINSKGITL